MNEIENYIHLTQGANWSEFKMLMGSTSVKVGDIYFTKHKIPFTKYFVGYAPKVNFKVQSFNFDELMHTAKEEKCAFIRFDVPNVPKHSVKNVDTKWLNELYKYTVKSPRNTFAKWNILLDISKPEEFLLNNLYPKTRYNTKLAAKKGVTVRIENNDNGINIFNNLMKETAKRHDFLIHSDEYYKKVFDVFNKKDQAYIMIAYYNDEPLSAWMLLIENNILYYPYGASSEKNKNLMASNLLAWEAIKLGKKKDCILFDMWGATNDRFHPWWGFTQFKLRYGGELIEYMDSYDFVVNKLIYKAFNFSYSVFWRLRKK